MKFPSNTWRSDTKSAFGDVNFETELCNHGIVYKADMVKGTLKKAPKQKSVMNKEKYERYFTLKHNDKELKIFDNYKDHKRPETAKETIQYKDLLQIDILPPGRMHDL